MRLKMFSGGIAVCLLLCGGIAAQQAEPAPDNTKGESGGPVQLPADCRSGEKQRPGPGADAKNPQVDHGRPLPFQLRA